MSGLRRRLEALERRAPPEWDVMPLFEHFRLWCRHALYGQPEPPPDPRGDDFGFWGDGEGLSGTYQDLIDCCRQDVARAKANGDWPPQPDQAEWPLSMFRWVIGQ